MKIAGVSGMKRVPKVLCAMALCGVALTSCVRFDRDSESSRYTTVFGERVERTGGQFILMEGRGWIEEPPPQRVYYGGGPSLPMPGFSFGVNGWGSGTGFHGHYEPGHH